MSLYLKERGTVHSLVIIVICYYYLVIADLNLALASSNLAFATL